MMNETKVPMNDFMLVAIVDGTEDLFHDEGGFFLCE